MEKRERFKIIPFNFEIKDSSLSKYRIYLYGFIICLIYINIILPCLFLYVFPLFWESKVDTVFIIGFTISINLIFFPVVFQLIRTIKPIQRTKVFISNKELKVFIQNKLYSQFFLDDLLKLEIIKIRWNGYRLNFKGSNSSETLRLFLFIFKKRKQKALVNILKHVAEERTINYSEIIENSDDEDKIKQIQSNIKKFIQK